MKYTNNCPVSSITPYRLIDPDKSIIEHSIKKLSKKIKIQNKLFGCQFLKDQLSNLYALDFNLRPFGGFEMGSYDTDISNQNWISYLFGTKPPEEITYNNTIQCFYKEEKQFGYSDIERVKTILTKPIKFRVKNYD